MKRKKITTDSYQNYSFNDEQYNENPPWWLDELDLYMGQKDKIFGHDKNVLQPIVYTFYDVNKHPLYVGKSKRFNNRMVQHKRAADGKEPWMKDVRYCGLICLESLEEMDVVEVLESHKKLAKYSPDLKHDEEKYTPVFFGHKAFDVTTYYEEDVFPLEKLFEYEREEAE